MDERIPVAQTYKQDFDSRQERDDWEYHRVIRQGLAKRSEGELRKEKELRVVEFHYDCLDKNMILLRVDRHQDPTPKAFIFFIHGGLMTGSDCYVGVNNMRLDWGRNLLLEEDYIILSVEYGRPPQNQGLRPSNNCWDAFRWAWDNHKVLGIDRNNVVVYAPSAGGCLATSMILRWMVAHKKNPDLSEDTKYSKYREIHNPPFPNLKGVYLEAPMLDDRHQTISRRQYAKGDVEVGGNLTSTQLGYAWGWLLNEYEKDEEGNPLKVTHRRVGIDDVSILEAPGRATAAQLKGFPPVCVEVGDADPLRDEGKDFIDRIRVFNESIHAEFKLCEGGVPHGGWAIDEEKKEEATRDILAARAEKLREWLA